MWWELRRILYNVILFVSLTIAVWILELTVERQYPGEDMIEPFAMIAYLFFCNVGYTMGCIIELGVSGGTQFASRLFKIGTIFSVGLILFSPIINIFYALFRWLN